MSASEFLTDPATLQRRITEIDPRQYERTRNFLNGQVTRLSPFFTHGILDPARTLEQITAQHGASACFKIISEFSWREYFQRIWQEKNEAIFTDLKRPQDPVSSPDLPTAIAEARTGIDTLDDAINELKTTGYMHNHARMWLASLTCNIAQTHWLQPAQWLHYHLLDGDPASNALSWQWCAGTFSSKKYLANQDNLNKYSGQKQSDTLLDVSYPELAELSSKSPAPLFEKRAPLALKNNYPPSTLSQLDSTKATLLYSLWNLDPTWESEHPAETHQRILLIEPSVYDAYPMSPLRWEFILHWAKQIPDLQLFVGELPDLFPTAHDAPITYREHPLTAHWPGTQTPRPWIHAHTAGYFPSFSAYWKAIKKNRLSPTLDL